MQALNYGISGSQTIAVWPEVTASYVGNPSQSLDIFISQDYDRSSSKITTRLLNTPNAVLPRLVLSMSRADIPQNSGFYTAEIKEGLSIQAKWGDIATQFGQLDMKWSEATTVSDYTTLDTDRVWVSGSNDPSFTQYESPNENGTYSTYNG